jgi:hypothetical protein
MATPVECSVFRRREKRNPLLERIHETYYALVTKFSRRLADAPRNPKDETQTPRTYQIFKLKQL